MNEFPTRLESLTEAHLQQLISGKIGESRSIEYKAELPGGSREEKLEFLHDVSSFANAAGGHIVYGMKANNGLPVKLVGFSPETIDAEILRLDQIIRTGIEPPILGLQIRAVSLPTAGSCALVIEIPRGLFGLHMIKNRGAFVARSSAGKVHLDVTEIRTAFIGGESLAARMREFRAERIARLLGGESFPKLGSSSLIVLHVLPFASFAGGIALDLARLSEAVRNSLKPIRPSGWSSVYTLDGFGNYTVSDNAKPNEHVDTYALLFRNGCIEAVESALLNKPIGVEGIPSGAFEVRIIPALDAYRKVLTELEIPLPHVIGLSLLDVRGLPMILNPRYDLGSRRIAEQHLILPEFTIERTDQDSASALRPAFDAVWNACGLARSYNYDESGALKPMH
jgi:hypothetical protein